MTTERERVTTALGARGADKPGGEEGGEGDGGARVRGGDGGVDAPRATAHVHHDVVDQVVTVEVVVEQQVTGLELGQRHVDHGRVLGLGGARNGDPGLRP